MRLASFATAALFVTCATAQPAPDPAYPAPAEQGQQGAPSAAPRGGAGYNAANVTHDGRLTRDQAQAGGMTQVARHFDEIDADRKGYVTKQDIRAWRQAKRAARQARMAPQQGAQPGAYPPASTPPAATPPVGGEQPGPPPQ